MSFLYPLFLWSLVLIIVPVIIHLFNFRVYKPVYFSNLNFLQDVKEASQSKSKLKQLVILLLRIFSITALVVAFSGPYIPLIEKNKIKEEKIIEIYLDNSFSMNAESRYGNIFDAAKERARKIIAAYDNKQKFLFSDNKFEVEHRYIVYKEQVSNFINRTKLAPEIRKLSELIDYQTQILNRERKAKNIRKDIFLISDFQKISSDFENIQTDSNSRVFLIPLSTGKVNNLYIDSCWFDAPQHSLNKAEELKVRIKNSGAEEYQDIPVKLMINGKQKSINSFDIAKQSETIVNLNYVNTETGIISGLVEITDYPITYDNTFYFTYSISKNTKILIINDKGQNKYLQALYESNKSFEVDFQSSGNIKPSEFTDYKLIIIDEIEELSSGIQQELYNYVQQGASIVIIPTEKININSYNQLLAQLNSVQILKQDTVETELAQINYRHFLYKNVFKDTKKHLLLPKISIHYKTTKNIQNTDKILLSALNKDALLLQGNSGKGKYYIFTFPLNTSNTGFYLHPVFVPTLYNMAAFSQNISDIYYTLGNTKPVDVHIKLSGDNILRIVSNQSDYEFIPKIIRTGRQNIKIDFMNQIDKAGNYYVLSDKDTLIGLSFNYNRKESDTQYFTIDEINKMIEKYHLNNFSVLSADSENFGTEIHNLQTERKNLWKWFIIMALIFLTAEVLTIKLWKE
ncbi:MAG: BatA domain-containing protein [Bacteroidales bacterium]|nr:BatA domain-containing protein [Bacteroidales bacterium]